MEDLLPSCFFRGKVSYRDELLETNLLRSLEPGGIVSSWGLTEWREMLLFYSNFGAMGLHYEEMLHIYIILGPFCQSRRETGEIAAVVQDSLSGKVVPLELLYLRRILISVGWKRGMRS